MQAQLILENRPEKGDGFSAEAGRHFRLFRSMSSNYCGGVVIPVVYSLTSAGNKYGEKEQKRQRSTSLKIIDKVV
jgi:hypothetical protein